MDKSSTRNCTASLSNRWGGRAVSGVHSVTEGLQHVSIVVTMIYFNIGL